MKLLGLSLLALASQAGLSVAESLVREPHFWSPKNIYISVLVPGASHTTWVLEIGQKLAARGHNVTFIGKDDGAKIAQSYRGMNVLSLGAPNEFHSDEDMRQFSDRPQSALESTKLYFQALNAGFRKDYLRFGELIKASRPDLMICDVLTDSCMRSADERGIPYAITSTVAAFPDATAPFMNSVFSSEPTTERQSIWTRFYNTYVAGMLLIPHLGPVFEEFTSIREELGISSAKEVFAPKVKESVKLINNFYGLEIARAIGPLIKFVGPIMPSSYPEMDAATSDFLTLHQKIVYAAFGHHIIPTAQEFEKVLVSLIDSVEDGTVDGFLWATVQMSDFPEKIVTSKGTQLNVTEILQNPQKYPHYKFVKWAPQFAILSHSSTALFMTHGGANSIFESLYTGQKMLIHPYLADQPANGQIMADAGVALVNNRYKVASKDIAEKIRTLVQDKDGFFADNLRRMSALAQLQSIDAVDRAAAAVEEILFTSKGDSLPHLIPPSSKMTYLKANNIDIQILLATCVVSVVALALGFVYMLIRAALTLFGKAKKSKVE
ncbi:hypothetical protein K450DRAFT_249098 [Umbelopsis ramanniana AG]|uniref:Uncharacterized protein n=1 Tax=Umbelopsis ramanniana AG TaxID=1314678 RepID=A0AAD5E7D6_UMBRA|nr:uncharacterized protein K450DRAFT_249098 [Umbelopsis ramanniana AG]KAI8578112.1 hypothetical protein K450DRAFT_249098 [Umbelopsis ramanniana AG]